MKSRTETASGAPPRGSAPMPPHGSFVDLDGEEFYRIASLQKMPPFLVSLPSDTDLWMFVTSRGGLTAGRVNASGAIFPYLTVDQLHDAHHHTGPITLLRVAGTAGETMWEPFAGAEDENPDVLRSLSKNVAGNRLVFEETRRDLGLTFRYSWAACDEFGWVRTATLVDESGEARRVEVLDGLRNVLPYGAPLGLYQQASNLVDAYKKSEIDPDTGLGVFSLTAGITDRAEALEMLRANVVWCSGLPGRRTHLAPETVHAFRHGRVLPHQLVSNGRRGHYLVSASVDLAAHGEASWSLVADTGRDHVQIAALRARLRRDDPAAAIRDGVGRATANLRRIVASADGLQLTGSQEAYAHHFANVLFNCMRGGVFNANHEVPGADFADFVRLRNADAAERRSALLADLPDSLTVEDLHERVRAAADADLSRLAYEYLPLYFGRRHGDPSRPWNAFEIRTRGRNGERELSYQGNWRDIFQNWEALCTAFPGFLPNVVAKFVNASTVDGYNPYRITREGVDWETVTPEDPWSNIGYWGDHQIIYLLKLLEALRQHRPQALGRMLGDDVFSYADVPYRIKPYADLVRDPSDTIVYDDELDARIAARVAARGSDGRLLTGADGAVLHVNLFEKLLVPALSKLSNLVPGGGIWMNTQRPEWNDANNALAGGAVSVVTLGYLRRYLAFMIDLMRPHADETLPVSREVARWLQRITAIFADERALQGDALTPASRRRLMDRLGGAFGEYRATVYADGPGDRDDVPVARAMELCRAALTYVDAGLTANRRDDGLYHTYNLLDADAPEGAVIGRLPVMLEGQVSVLSSGLLSPEDALEILEQLFASDLYRESERSFLLYPEKRLPGFLERNAVPADAAGAVPLLRDMLAAGDPTILAPDADGVLRFHGDLQKAADLAALLDGLAERGPWAEAAQRDRRAALDLFESVFDHASYTGRSGVMYGYEGLGCIYWHMVAKLLLAVQEQCERADLLGAPDDVRQALARMYRRVRAGIGYEKTAAEYGAFPTDPYSHTPPAGGARQPGMTGQVKEEILTRRGELGLQVRDGALRFRPRLLGTREFLASPASFRYFDTAGQARSLDLEAGALAFTCCQVPVVYRRATGAARIALTFADGGVREVPGDTLPPDLSGQLFSREGRIARIDVTLPAERLAAAPDRSH